MQAMFGLLIAVCVTVCTVSLSFLEGQQMDEEQTMKLMKEFVALKPDEVPGFEAKAITLRVDLKERDTNGMRHQ